MARVLLVDDEPCFRKYVRAGLEKCGVLVQEAPDAHSARQILKSASVDLLVVDVMLDGQPAGLNLAEHVGRRYRNTGVIVISGAGKLQFEDASRSIGALDYLEKPFELRVLEESLCRFLLRRLQEQEALLQCTAALEVWPVAYLSAEGEVLFVTASGRDALDACVDPAAARPIQRVDRRLLDQLKDATRDNIAAVICRRDRVLSEFSVLVRSILWREREALALFFAPVDDLRGEADRIQCLLANAALLKH